MGFSILRNRMCFQPRDTNPLTLRSLAVGGPEVARPLLSIVVVHLVMPLLAPLLVLVVVEGEVSLPNKSKDSIHPTMANHRVTKELAPLLVVLGEVLLPNKGTDSVYPTMANHRVTKELAPLVVDAGQCHHQCHPQNAPVYHL
mmetsp:Transcript_63578/g.87386  ORF Transcript_63578/g.87386 Transcript_63578/m.87386 type:complete len:143 (+) Transcript_63578:210-638(+)